jgi:hypothetical protein
MRATEALLLLLLLPEKGSVLLCISSLALLSLQAFQTRRDTERKYVSERERERKIGGGNAETDEFIRVLLKLYAVSLDSFLGLI